MTKKEQEMIASGDYIQCPICAEIIRTEAKKCRFCGNILDLKNNVPQIEEAEEILPLSIEEYEKACANDINDSIKCRSIAEEQLDNLRKKNVPLKWLCIISGFFGICYIIYSIFYDGFFGTAIDIILGGIITYMFVVMLEHLTSKEEEKEKEYLECDSDVFFKSNLPIALELAKIPANTRYETYYIDKNFYKTISFFEHMSKMISIIDYELSKVSVFPSFKILGVNIRTNEHEVVIPAEKKSVLKRAVVGGVVGGGVGAIVGAASGLTPNEPAKVIRYLENVWVELTIDDINYSNIKIYTNTQDEAIKLKRER